MGIRLENIYKSKRALLSNHKKGNFEMICESCNKHLGLLHTDPISENLFLEKKVELEGDSYVTCPCGTKHGLEQYLERAETTNPQHSL